MVREEIRMKRLACFLALLMVALSGCEEKKAPASGPSTGKKKYRFAIVPKMLNNPVFNYGKIAAEKTAAEIARTEGVEIEILWKAPPVSNPAEQAALVESLASQGVDGISVSVDEAN